MAKNICNYLSLLRERNVKICNPPSPTHNILIIKTSLFTSISSKAEEVEIRYKNMLITFPIRTLLAAILHVKKRGLDIMAAPTPSSLSYPCNLDQKEYKYSHLRYLIYLLLRYEIIIKSLDIRG